MRLYGVAKRKKIGCAFLADKLPSHFFTQPVLLTSDTEIHQKCNESDENM